MDVLRDFNKLCACIIILLAINLQINGQSSRWDGKPWYSPVIISPDASVEEKNSLEAFNKELAYAKKAADETTFYKLTDHIENAVKLRPDHPDNIKLEYKMAVAMSQYENSENVITPERYLKAMNLFKKIADTYNHMDYYSNSLTDSVSIECPQLMIPRACNYYANSRIKSKDFEDAKKYATIALDCFAETCNERVSHYLNRPEPKRSFILSGLGAEEKYQRSVEEWKRMKEMARNGDVLGEREIFHMQVSIKEYWKSFGDNQGNTDVIASMTEIINRYEGTPMAKFAKEFLAKSSETMAQGTDDNILLDEETDVTSKSLANDLQEKHLVSKRNKVVVCFATVILVFIAMVTLVYRRGI